MSNAETYLVWSNEHSAWWGPNNAGYYGKISSAGCYTRDEALKICVNARGGRQFNENPSEVPVLLADAEVFWPDDRDEWECARRQRRYRADMEAEAAEDAEVDDSGYSRADEDWFFGMDGKP